MRRKVFGTLECRQPEQAKHNDDRDKNGANRQRQQVIPHDITRVLLPTPSTQGARLGSRNQAGIILGKLAAQVRRVG